MTFTRHPDEKRIKRHTVSDLDGTREGGLVFCIAVIGGMITAAIVSPLALTSFWVWVGLLSAAAGIGVSVQKLVARVEAGED